MEPQPIVCIFDATKIGSDLLLAARVPLKSNLAWSWIKSETKESYASMKAHLESKGFTFTCVVIDGRRGIPMVFNGIPVQICQFHQMQIVKRKLTLRPETEAGQELLSLAMSLAKTNQETLENELNEWHIKYKEFFNVLHSHNESRCRVQLENEPCYIQRGQGSL